MINIYEVKSEKEVVNLMMFTWLCESVVSVQYTTTLVADRTIAFSPTGGMRGDEGSGVDSSLVRFDSYLGWPSPISLNARTLITYSEFGSVTRVIIYLKTFVIND